MIVSLISSRSRRGCRLGASIAATVWLALAPAAPAGVPGWHLRRSGQIPIEREMHVRRCAA